MSATLGQDISMVTVDDVPLFISTTLLALGGAAKAKKISRKLLQLGSKDDLALTDSQ